MPAIFVNGQYLVLQGISGNVGDTNSVASIVVPINVPDLPTAFSIRAEEVAAALGISGLRCTDRPLSQDTDGEYTVAFRFEGFNESVSFDQAQEFVEVSWDADMKEEPIQTHPSFPLFKAEYGWSDENGFPEFSFHQDSTALPGPSNKKKENPLFGVESWLKVGGVFRRSYAVTVVPATVYRGIGTLVEYPPDAERLNIPRFKKRQWLKMAPLVTPSGSAFRVEESYKLTGQTNGSEAIIYAAGQLEE